MVYLTHKCRSCGLIETDYNNPKPSNINSFDLIDVINSHKIHICAEFEGCTNYGVMDVIGYHDVKAEKNE